MRTFDLSPLLRASVGFDGFDRLFDQLNRAEEQTPGYPPYNIEKQGDDTYRITMAVAGFRDEELNITVQENMLVISGRAAETAAPQPEQRFLHRGIARRAFERRFQLADTVKVSGASLEHGLLHVDLVRVVPEERKARSIPINKAPQVQPSVIDAKAA